MYYFVQAVAQIENLSALDRTASILKKDNLNRFQKSYFIQTV